MKGGKQLEAKVKTELKSLQDEEYKLFRSYNRHATAEFKLGILIQLQTVINKIEVLKSVQN